MTVINKVSKEFSKSVSNAVTSTKAPVQTNSLFNQLKKKPTVKKHSSSTYTKQLNNLTKQSKTNIKGSRIDPNALQQQEVNYKASPLDMSGMINPYQILQNTALMNTMFQPTSTTFTGRTAYGAPMTIGEALSQKMAANGMVSPASTAIPSGGTISLAQAESLISEYTGVNKFQGGTKGSLSAAEKRELATYLQRYVAEGAARGVDVVSMIKNKGGTIKLGLANGWGSGIGVGGGGMAMFSREWWNKTSVGKRMGLFFQEFSHALGFMMDSQNPKYGFERGWMHGAQDATNASLYTNNFDMLFSDMRKYGLVGNKVVSMGATGGGMGIPSGGLPGVSAAGNPYNDLANGIMAGLAGTMGGGIPGMPGAAAPVTNIIQPPTITPPAPIPTVGAPNTGMAPLQGMVQPQVGQPGSLAGPTIGIGDTTPYGGGSGYDGGSGDASDTTSAFDAELADIDIPQTSVPMLQGIAGALLGA